jgi:hypothetical protein
MAPFFKMHGTGKAEKNVFKARYLGEASTIWQEGSDEHFGPA